jgi:glycosidase
MNKSAILHIHQSQYAFANDEKTMTIRLRAASDDLTACTLYYGDRACSSNPAEFVPLPMELRARDDLFDYYEITFDTPYNRVFYYFKLEKEEEWTYYYSERFSKELPRITLNGILIEGRNEYYQYPIILKDEIPDVPDWFKNAIVYNIFPDSFASGKRRIADYEKQVRLENGLISKSRLGGTLKGITENLDYISDLGFTCIYINPIFTAGEYHKYDLLDYFHIDPCFGTDEDFRELVEKVHERSMRIIIDGVFNHCSWYFFAFDDVVRNGENSEFKDWFYDLKFPVIRPDSDRVKPSYTCFAYERKMPKLNTSNKKVQEYFEGVCRYWIREFKIDGWRLDVADEVDKNFWRNFRRAAKEENPETVLIGEVWDNAENWLRGDAFESTMNYDFRCHCRDFFGLGRQDAFQFAGNIAKMMLRYPTNIMHGQLNLLDSHDVPRFLSLCRDDIRKWKLAFAFLMLFPGVPCMYYGDEKGVRGIAESDYRSPMPWQSGESKLADFVKELVRIRKKHTTVKADYRVIRADKESRIFAFCRTQEQDKLLVVMNAGEKEESMELPRVKQVLMEEGIVSATSDFAVVKPYGLAIYLA